MSSNRREFLKSAAVAGAAGAALSGTAEAAGPAYAVKPEPIPSLPIVASGARFPVRRIYCMGLNYKSHVDEGRGGFKAPPFYFQKAANMIVQNGGKVRYPLQTHEYAYELEMVVALKSGGTNIAKERALDCVYGYAVGLDMTRRDLQFAAMQSKLPWEPGKSFDESAPCSAITPASKIGHMSQARIQLKVNDKIRQDSDISEMILDVPEIIAMISQSVELAAGDLIYTGTPAGSASVVSGDRMVGTVDKLGALAIGVA